MPSGFFALLDDIALLMDDVAAMTKVAGKKITFHVTKCHQESCIQIRL